mmetsp:Transcript_29708/g.36861  ORF Transcript_29708/g.36861 Transcript_29708/m.36861 type:complete len:89 (+) Transcript_29708:150-416(+)
MGATTEIFAYLTPQEVIKMQGLNKWMYAKAVSRVQMRYRLPKTLLFTDWRRNILHLHIPSYECKMQYQNSIDLAGWYTTQLGQNLFQI